MSPRAGHSSRSMPSGDVFTEKSLPQGEDGETPVTENYEIKAPYTFTGTIARVTIDVKEMMKADKAQENKLRAEATVRKALCD
jgi:hypothetical protein